jgi:uncharacterized protein (TIGR02301 family)
LGGAALAQSAPPKPTEAPLPAVEIPPAYETQLLRLAELMGALDYLGELCTPGEGGAFRAKMAALLEVEAKTMARKELLSGAFNRGFQDYALGYSTCTPAARTIIARFLDETSKLTKDVSDRFGG